MHFFQATFKFMQISKRQMSGIATEKWRAGLALKLLNQ
jgi:hypothetical protein